MITLHPHPTTRVPRQSRWSATFSPAGLMVRGLLLLAAFGVVHALGWREHTAFLSLTASPGLSLPATTGFGLAYLGLYFGAVLGTPTLIGAAGLLYLWNHVQPAATPPTAQAPRQHSPAHADAGKLPA